MTWRRSSVPHLASVMAAPDVAFLPLFGMKP